ncbi:glycyl radical protein [bacterium]|nr:glycyl radical protein [bacterium]
MNERVTELRRESRETPVSLSMERAVLITEYYRENEGKLSTPMLRASTFAHLCERKTLHLGKGELIVGERGPAPRAVPTFPELTCHSEEDLRILRDREKIPYAVSEEDIHLHLREVLPYWQGRSLRDQIFKELPLNWKDTFAAGVFTEFMEQRAPGHTTLDGKPYEKGLLDFKAEIAAALDILDRDPDDEARSEQLRAMDLACDGVIRFAERHADLADELAELEEDPARREELRSIAHICRHVPAHAPRTFHEALQMYWFLHLGTVTELNGWDSMNPGHLDRHLLPFYERELAAGKLTKEDARELLQCFLIKFNNQPAPPKVGVTAAESGTYNDFTNINLGGILRDGSDGVNELSFLILEVFDEIHLLQPQCNIQLSRKSPDSFLKAALRVLRKGYGYPSMFNVDGVVAQMLRCGKTLADARDGGSSGCVETGAFGKEAYILTGYFNTPKILEITLHNGFDPRTQKQLGPKTGDPREFANYEDLFAAFQTQLRHFMDIKLPGNAIIEAIYAEKMPAVFLSVLIDDCIEKGLDYNAGGARYNTSFVQGVGIGSITDSLSALKTHVFEGALSMDELLAALNVNFEDREEIRRTLSERSPRYGNDDDAADAIMRDVFDTLFDAVDGRPNLRGGRYHLDMLPTTCHIYFGSVLGATPEGRHAGLPVSEGISPVQGADRKGPTAVLKSAAKMDHLRTCGTLLNMKFLPGLLSEKAGIEKVAMLLRGYFRLDGHHIQLNVVDAQTLRAAQAKPEEHRDLIVRVAGYSDYFCDLSRELQDEIILRRAHGDA